MLEIKVTIEDPELTNTINNLATALGNAKITQQPQTAPAPHPTATPEPAPTTVAPQSQPTAPAPAPATPAPQSSLPVAGVPLAQPPKYTAEQIMTAGATLMDAGKATDLINLLTSFGVKAVMELKPEQYGAFATAMRELGAKI